MSNVKLEETHNRRRLHIGSFFVDLNESDYRELINIFGAEKHAKGREWNVGDIVRITDCKQGHGFNNNDEVELLRYDKEDKMWHAKRKFDCWWITTEEAELI